MSTMGNGILRGLAALTLVAGFALSTGTGATSISCPRSTILPTLGHCAPGTVPVYRVFDGRIDTNHRYTIERSVRDQMVALGWVAEGDGPDFVVMCAPQ